MPIEVFCDACDKSYKVGRNMAGKTVKCASCDAVIDVPGDSDNPVAALAALARGSSAPSPAARPASPVQRPAPAERSAPPQRPVPIQRPTPHQRPAPVYRPAPAQRPASQPPPQSVPSPEYDLAALHEAAAAEIAAEALEERVYIPPPPVEVEYETPRERRQRTAARSRSRYSGSSDLRNKLEAYNISMQSLFIESPMFYAQCLAGAFTLGAMVQIPAATFVGAQYLVFLLVITAFTVYFKFLLGCSKEVTLLAAGGFAAPLYALFIVYCASFQDVGLFIQSEQFHCRLIVGICLLIALGGIIYTASVEPLRLTRAFISLAYLVLDVCLLFTIGFQAAAFLSAAHAAAAPPPPPPHW